MAGASKSRLGIIWSPSADQDEKLQNAPPNFFRVEVHGRLVKQVADFLKWK
jgi:hypothetical protein